MSRSSHPPLANRVLSCDRLSKKYGGVAALTDVTVEFPASGLVALIGPNGAGKSTLLNVMTGFVRPDCGQCTFGSAIVSAMAPFEVARLGLVRTFQDIRFVSDRTALENVMLACPSQHSERAFIALFGAGLGKEEANTTRTSLDILSFVGLYGARNQAAGMLSYGQQKLLTLACAIATEASVLLLDEPLAGIHPELAQEILKILRTLADRSKLIVFVEHNLDAVRSAADLAIVMDAGRIIAVGTPSEVLERSNVIEVYLG